jgi:hypothetical protein
MLKVNPADVIYSLNSLRPQCPVLFNSITFSYINSEERVRRAYRRLESSGESYSSVGPMHIPTSNYDHVEEEQRSYVFPSCGHVHGYHKSLQDRCCPAVSSSLFPLHLFLLPFLPSSPLPSSPHFLRHHLFTTHLPFPCSTRHCTTSDHVLYAGRQAPLSPLHLPLNQLYAIVHVPLMSSIHVAMWLHGMCVRSGQTY